MISDRYVRDYVRGALAGDVVTCSRCLVTFGLGFLVGDSEKERADAHAFLRALGWSLRRDVAVCQRCAIQIRSMN